MYGCSGVATGELARVSAVPAAWFREHLMAEVTPVEALLIDRIRRQDEDAWRDLIARYEGRLLAFVESRAGRRSAAEDIVQETFLGFLTSLTNYDGKRSLESWLFSICAHKLTDYLRREGRRPALSLSSRENSDGSYPLAGTERVPSTIARSVERRALEEKAVVEAIRQQVEQWRQGGEWTKLKCMELLFLAGWPNKDVAAELDLTEQQVANFKFEFLSRLRKAVRKQGLSPDVFPQLYES
jgi:RNA polymerase sigma-70 factor (ECF subfamily)